MEKPVRIQLSRTKGFRLREISLALNGLEPVKVDRTSPFGNPYCVSKDPYARPARWNVSNRWGVITSFSYKAQAITYALLRFEEDIETEDRHHLFVPVPTRAEIVTALSGRNLTCWCRQGDPCHADILLRLANPKRSSHVQG